MSGRFFITSSSLSLPFIYIFLYTFYIYIFSLHIYVLYYIYSKKIFFLPHCITIIFTSSQLFSCIPYIHIIYTSLPIASLSQSCNHLYYICFSLYFFCFNYHFHLAPPHLIHYIFILIMVHTFSSIIHFLTRARFCTDSRIVIFFGASHICVHRYIFPAPHTSFLLHHCPVILSPTTYTRSHPYLFMCP